MKNKIIALLIVIAILASISGIFYIGFYVKRTINYSLYYEDAVKATIREMVKPEALK